MVTSSVHNDSKHVSPLGSFKSYESGQLDLNYQDDFDEDYTYDEFDYVDYDYGDEVIENDLNFNLASKFDDLDLPTGIEASVPWMKNAAEDLTNIRKKFVVEDEIGLKYRSFKQFDTVRDHSDHYFSRPELLKTVPSTIKVNQVPLISSQFLISF